MTSCSCYSITTGWSQWVVRVPAMKANPHRIDAFSAIYLLYVSEQVSLDLSFFISSGGIIIPTMIGLWRLSVCLVPGTQLAFNKWFKKIRPSHGNVSDRPHAEFQSLWAVHTAVAEDNRIVPGGCVLAWGNDLYKWPRRELTLGNQ